MVPAKWGRPVRARSRPALRARLGTGKLLIGTSVTVLILILFPVRRTALAHWTVTVTDETGTAVSDILVAQSWSDYAVGERGSREARTDSSGRVVFGRWSRWRPLGYLAVRRLGVMVNVHGGRGRSGWVWVPYDARIRDLEPGKGTGAVCHGTSCIGEALTSELRLRVVRSP